MNKVWRPAGRSNAAVKLIKKQIYQRLVKQGYREKNVIWSTKAHDGAHFPTRATVSDADFTQAPVISAINFPRHSSARSLAI